MFRLQHSSSLALVVCLSVLTAGCGGGRPTRERRPRATSEATTPATSASTAPKAEAKPIDASTLGSIEVTVKYTGDPKLSKEIKLDSDPFCATAKGVSAQPIAHAPTTAQ